MQTPDSLDELIQALRCLPGVGPKSATRMAYHLLQRDHAGAGRLSAADLAAKVKAGGGKAALTTVEGETLTVASKGGALWLWDAKGGSSRVTIANVNQSNGVIHVIDTVLTP